MVIYFIFNIFPFEIYTGEKFSQKVRHITSGKNFLPVCQSGKDPVNHAMIFAARRRFTDKVEVIRSKSLLKIIKQSQHRSGSFIFIQRIK